MDNLKIELTNEEMKELEGGSMVGGLSTDWSIVFD